MDFIVEFIALGIDSVVLLTCLKQYYEKKNSAKIVSTTPTVTLDKKLKRVLANADAKLPYIAIRGAVKPIGVPIISNNNPNVSGVIQSLKIKEHVVQRSTSGFWSDSERTIQEVHNVIPFGLESKGVVVEVVDPLVAEYLDMDTISDTFHPTVPSMMDHIWGFFSGYRQRGIQSTEKMLREGTVMTGIGQLVFEQDGSFKLQPPTNGEPFYLTTMPISSLLKKLQISKRNYGIVALICTAIGVVVAGIAVKKYLNKRKRLKDEENEKVYIEETRRKRRRQIRDPKNLFENVCAVCKSNPVEIILLPCGHVCLCEDCAEDITDQCPICRSNINTKSVAYVL